MGKVNTPAKKGTPFGRTIRRLRVNAEQTLADVAQKIGVSVAFLSAVETGIKPAPDSLVQRIAAHFGIKGQELVILADQSRDQMTIDVRDATDGAKEMIAMFARRFSELNEEEVAKMKKLLIAEKK